MRDGFGQFCPVAAACEIFAQRWTPLILRELLAGSHRFNEIHRCVPRMSRGLLTRRLGELEAAGVITSEPSTHGRGREYHLSESGREFRAVIEALGTWGQRWTVRVRPGHLDAELLMWNLRRRIALDRLPARRVVVRFHFTGAPATYRGAKTFWLVLEPCRCGAVPEGPRSRGRPVPRRRPIFRNPRHHRIIEDDEQKAQAIISIAELLIALVDASQDREPAPESS